MPPMLTTPRRSTPCRVAAQHRSLPRLLESLEPRILLSATVPATPPEVVIQWNTVALEALRLDTTEPGPTWASRNLAMVQAAVFDAVNSIDHSYTPYLINLHTPQWASIDAAAAQAAHDTLTALYPLQKASFDQALQQTRAQIPDGQAEDLGLWTGQTVARRILLARRNDGSDNMTPYTPIDAPGYWQPDPLHPDQTALGPNWGTVTPFAIPSVTSYLAPPPPALTSTDYAQAFQEVKTLGGDGLTTPTTRTADQTQIGQFWAYDVNRGTPLVLFNQVTQTLALQQHQSTVQNARLFALTNLAMADAGIAAWDAKYHYNFWRPITALRAADTDGNPLTTPDPSWVPLGPPSNGGPQNYTPPFPSYTSGHANFGGALFSVLQHFYGTDQIHFTLTSDEFRDAAGNPTVTRSYHSFSQARQENIDGRIYLGIHFRFDQEVGNLIGQRIGSYVFTHLLRPQTPCDPTPNVPSFPPRFPAAKTLRRVVRPAVRNGGRHPHPASQGPAPFAESCPMSCSHTQT